MYDVRSERKAMERNERDERGGGEREKVSERRGEGERKQTMISFAVPRPTLTNLTLHPCNVT